MTVEDALRKIALLRRVSADKGALAAERETAHRLQKALMERYAIKAQEVPEGPPTTPFRLHWDYWQELLDEFDLKLRHFGGRGSAEVGSNMIAYIRLATNNGGSTRRLRAAVGKPRFATTVSIRCAPISKSTRHAPTPSRPPTAATASPRTSTSFDSPGSSSSPRASTGNAASVW